jgi:hypothetical protein
MGTTEARPRWRLISWWSPIAPALVLPPLEGGTALQAADLEARLKLASRAAPWLTGSAAITLLALIIGLPVASARFGGIGFFAGAAVVLTLAAANAAAGAITLRRLGSPGRRGQVLGWCSPFAAGRVLETVLEVALAGASQAQAVRALAAEDVFAAWSRPRAYDVVFSGAHDTDLRAAADETTLKAIVAARPPHGDAGATFCQRCAATWMLTEGACPACAVPLTSLTSGG